MSLRTPSISVENKELLPSQRSNINSIESSYTSSSRSPTNEKGTEAVLEETCASDPSLSPHSLEFHQFSSQTVSEMEDKTKAGPRVKYQEYSAKNTGPKSLVKKVLVNTADSKEFDITNMSPGNASNSPEALNFHKENIFDNVADSSSADLLEFLSDDSENNNQSELNNLGFQAVELSSEPDIEATSSLGSDAQLHSNEALENESVSAASLKPQEKKTEPGYACAERIVPGVVEQLENTTSEDIQNQIVKVLSAENKHMITDTKSYNWYERARGKPSIFSSSNLENYKSGIQFEKKTNSMKLIGHNVVEVEHSQELVKYNNLEREKKKHISEFQFEPQRETESDIEQTHNRHLKRKRVIEDDNYTDLLIEKFANKPKSKNLKQIPESIVLSDEEELDVYKPKKKVTLKNLMKDGRRTRYNYKIHVNPDTIPSFITQFMKPPDV